jgi:hypothetical protein
MEILIAFSLSNLLFIRDWKRLLYPTNELYHVKLTPYSAEYLGLILSVLLTAAIFLFGFWGIRHSGNGKLILSAKIIFFLIALVALNGIRHQLNEIFPAAYNYLNFLILTALLAIGFLSFFKSHNYFFDSARWFCLTLSPLLLLTFILGIGGTLTNHPEDETPIENQLSAIPAREKSTVKSRVVWIIFDEFDYAVPFEKRAVSLPEFEKFKQISLFATNAIPPAYTTRDATASLLTGKKIEASEAVSNDDLALKFGEEKANFSQIPNLFRSVKALQGETAVIGWLHPYCRVFAEDLSVCQWQSVDTYCDFERQPLRKIMFRQFQNIFISMPFGARLNAIIDNNLSESAEDSGYLKRHFEIMNATKSVIGNPKIDLAFIHLPFPHPPYYFNAEKGEFSSPQTKKMSLQNSYFDNLVLTDRMLGEIRKTLEDNNLWEDSTIIVSSDHQWRVNIYQNDLSEKERQITGGKEDARVPFFLKLKGQKETAIYDKPFNTVILHDLILAIMKGEVSTVNEAQTWLNRYSTR